MPRLALPLLLAALLIGACVNSAPRVERPLPILGGVTDPDTVGHDAREAALQANEDAAARAATSRRQQAIAAASHGRAHVTTAQATRLLDAPAITAATVVRLDSATTVEAHSFDGWYWGVRYGDEWGYVPAATVARNDDAQAAVTAPAPAATPADDD